MEQHTLSAILQEQTARALWEVKNVIDCVPDSLWDNLYCGMPCWKHIYHMLHSLDVWMINPRDPNYQEPSIHEPGLNNLDFVSSKLLTRTEINQYLQTVSQKITAYVEQLSDDQLLLYPPHCEYTKFTLLLAQFRHLHSHMGMLMGFIIDDTGKWPTVLGLEHPIPTGPYDKYC